MRVLVIGGVAAGMSAASKLKRENPQATIKVYEKGSDLSYGACGMPYYISDVIKNDTALIARTKKGFEERGISVALHSEVTGLDEHKKTITIENLKTGKITTDHYDKLIIASGAHAIRLPVEGSDLDEIHVLNSLDDARYLKECLSKKTVKNVTVIGAGFIGIEVVETLREMNIAVHLVERETQVLPQYDQDIITHVEQSLKAHNVTLHMGQTLQAYKQSGDKVTVITDKTQFETDFVIEAIGVRPNTMFLENTSINRLKNGAIIVNDKNETNVKDIYAAGDCATVYHRLKDSYEAYIPLGTHANKAGRIIAAQLSGEEKRFKGVIGSNILKAFELTVAKTGLSEKEAQAMQVNYGTITTKTASHAGYYPNATPIHTKVIYDKTTCRILGAQMIGEQGVGSRINIFATAIWNEMTAKGISEMDLAYAPPFASVWDSVQITTNQIKCHKGEDHNG